METFKIKLQNAPEGYKGGIFKRKNIPCSWREDSTSKDANSLYTHLIKYEYHLNFLKGIFLELDKQF